MKKAVSILLLSTIFLSSCNMFKKDPQETVDDGVKNLAEVEQMTSELSLNATVQKDGSAEIEQLKKVVFGVKASGSSDLSDEDSPKVDMIFSFNINADDRLGSGELRFRSLENKLYANLAKVALPGEAGDAVTTQLASVLDKWWILPAGEKNPISAITEQQKELQEKLKTMKFFVNAQEEGQEEIKGMPSTRYRVDVDREALKKFFLDMARISGSQLSPEEELAVADSLKDIEFSGAVWVGDDDDAVHRIRGTISMQPSDGASSLFEFDYTAWDFGKDVELVVPESVQEFNPLMVLPILGALGSFGDATGVENEPPEAEAVPGAPIDQPLGAKQSPAGENN